MRQRPIAAISQKKEGTRTIFIIGITILMLQLIFHLTVDAKSLSCLQASNSDSLKTAINDQLASPLLLNRLNFPKTVTRFYTSNSSQASWLKSPEQVAPIVSAMLLLDCVRQYGLQRENYHPEVLDYTLMYNIANKKEEVTFAQKATFELMLTDAMISMINHLHYGRFNPVFNSAILDSSLSLTLKSEKFLAKIVDSPNIMDSILTVQPSLKQYAALQAYMKLIAGQYVCDSYETPEPYIRAIAYNMERLRWIELKNDTYLQVNLPSFQLVYSTPDSTYSHKIIVGKQATPTPTLESEITYLETAPDWKIPQKIFINELLPKAKKDLSYFDNNHIAVYDEKENFVAITKASLTDISKHVEKFHARQTAGCDNALGKVVFRFKNNYAIYLHDTPEQHYFAKSKRAFSHGCIRIEHAEKLAKLLLKDDGQSHKIPSLSKAMENYKNQKFTLKMPVPLLITYLTFTVENGLLVQHNDIYKLDKGLEEKMYKQTIETLKK